ncbi:copper resistance CopC family protein [Neobacillus vireti]|uniref:copper resistance CopC family protein n=1 Tax=Neobacillus vireti TaxID=220686 RepID=UPI002FFE1BEE
MKKLILILFCTLMIIPSMVSAHTSISSSNPSEGQVVTENLEQIILNYATSIEELSTMKLFKDGKEIPLGEIKVENKQLIGLISETLDNGSYTIQWNIVGEDGHPIKGDINFSVQMEQNESDSVPPEDGQASQENDSQSNQTEQKSGEEKASDDIVQQPDVQNDDSSPTMLITIFVILIVIFGTVLLFFTRKKKS